MNNSDMPAMPQSGTEGASGDLNSSQEWGGIGLTKREHFAGLAMQGMLAGCAGTNIISKEIVTAATYIADALLAELEKSNG